MSDLAIRVEGLGKRYRIGAKQPSYGSFRDTLAGAVKAPFRRAARLLRGDAHGASNLNEELWALRNVSFEVRHGDVVGVVGRNGAGKSTLLKLLSRITEPTEGFAEIRGRVGSLLEVGTGFHPELSGRDNIYLNGAILGMRREEISRKFDEIVEFAEVERFIDTPVKHFSSGMYLRLAFAVAAHLEPEILVVDEVLAVGDVNFQRKCLGKMGDVASQGRTVLFVSHSMAAVQSLCTSCIVLASGGVRYHGEVEKAIQLYMQSPGARNVVVDLRDAPGRFGSGELRLQRFWVEDETGSVVDVVPSGSSCCLAVEYFARDGRPRRNVAMSVRINNQSGVVLSLVNTLMLNQDFAEAPPRGVIRLEIPKLPFAAGRYVIDLNLATHAGHTYADFINGAAEIDVVDGDFYGTGRAGNTGAPVMIEGSWRIEAAGGLEL